MNAISYSTEGQIGTITISRPERRNALNHQAVSDLHEAVKRASEDNLRCLVLRGSHGHFCAGADLTELEDLAFTDELRSTLDDFAALGFPTIAAIAGSCMGLGMQLALACDLRLATADARFAVPVAKLGLMVDYWTISRLSMCVGHSMARWMLLTARPISAERVAAAGLVQELVAVGENGEGGKSADPGETVTHEALELARHIATLAPLALSGSKLGLDLIVDGSGSKASSTGRDNTGRDNTDRDGSGPDSYREAFEAAWASEDLIEGRRAFGERRAPDFHGR